MRIEGSQLVVTCHQCGLSVVAAGYQEDPIESEKERVGSAAPAAPSGGEVVGGRFELEEGEEFPRSLRGHSQESKAFDQEIKVGTPPVVEPVVPLKIEAKPQTQGAVKTQPVGSVPVPPKPQPKPQPKITPEIQKEILSGVTAAPRGPLRKIAVVSGVLVSALVVFYLASPSKQTVERKLEPKAAKAIPTVAPPVAPTPAPAAAAPFPATPAAPPKPTLKPPKPTAPSAPPKPTPKPEAAAAVPAVISEKEALSSGLVDAELFQERAGRIMTRILLCRNLERSRDPDAALRAFDVTLVVSPSGAVSSVKLDRALEGSHLDACLRDQLGKLEFPSWTGRAIEIRRQVAQGAVEVSNSP
ncbi:MAG: hypothetical protein ACXVH0_02415 [Thermoanaerobaculia bacterium]